MTVRTEDVRIYLEKWAVDFRAGHPPSFLSIALWLDRTLDDLDDARAELRLLVDATSTTGFHPMTTAAYSHARAKLAEWETR